MNNLSNSLVSALTNNGSEIFIVGGSVRDELLGISEKSKDLDLLITNIDIDDLCHILKQHGTLDIVGKSFGVIKFKPRESDEVIDISVPRIDNKTGTSHKDFQVTIGKDITIQQDMFRRDFTINALAKNIITGDIIDITGKGVDDINHKTLRMVSDDSMKEDPLRMLRAIQFASRFKFNIDLDTMENIINHRRLIHSVAKDRFIEEFRKLFEKSSNPSIGIKLLSNTGIMEEIMSPLKLNTINLNAIDKLPKDQFESFMLLLLMPLHTTEFLTEFKFPSAFITLVKEAMEFIKKGSFSDTDIVILNNDKKSSDRLITIIDTVFNVIRISFSIEKRLQFLRSKNIPTCIKELPFDGNDLLEFGFKGQAIGKRLREFLLNGVL